jgi:hypothetical protein
MPSLRPAPNAVSSGIIVDRTISKEALLLRSLPDGGMASLKPAGMGPYWSIMQICENELPRPSPIRNGPEQVY